MKVSKFVSKYQGKILEDYGSFKSPEFIQFAKDLKSTIREICKTQNAKLVSYSVGHYSVSGFIERDGRFVYFSYDEPRHCAIDLYKSGCMNGILIRRAEHEKDFRGGYNHFTNIFLFDDTLNRVIA